MTAPVTRVLTPIEGRVVLVPSGEALDEKAIEEKARLDGDIIEILKDDTAIRVTEAKATHSDDSDQDSGSGAEDVIIVTGSDASKHLLSLRDDGQPALTFRSLVLATILSGFTAVMNQIYYVSCSTVL